MGLGRFLLGLLVGSATGAVLGLVLQQSPRASGLSHGGTGPAAGPLDLWLERGRKLVEQARSAFEQGRASTVHAGQSARTRTSEAAHAAGAGVVQVEEPAVQQAADVSNRVTGGIQGFGAELKARWREAVSEGKQTAAETEAELRRRYLEDTKRI